LAQSRAASRLARSHPEEYRERYAQALDRVRANAIRLSSRQAHQRASRQAHADLQACFRDEYAARVQAEQAALEPEEPEEVGRVERPVAARARLRALLWLADQHPDLTRQRFQAEATRLPLRPTDRAPARQRALAWVRALDGLRGAYPKLFQTRYAQELARHAGMQPSP
jgi:hypothetical protein